MLRNLRHVQLLRRLSLPPHSVVPDGTTATWWRSYTPESTTQEVTSEELTSQKQDESAASSKRKKSRRYPTPRSPPKGRVLHSRTLNEDEKHEQEEMRIQLQRQRAEDDVFGSKVRLSSWSKKQGQQKERPKSKGNNVTPKRGFDVDREQVESKSVNSEAGAAEVEVEQWEDTFGTMAEPLDLKVRHQIGSRESADNTEEIEDSDEEDHIPLREKGLSGHTVYWYIRQIEKLGKEGKVYEAIQMLEKTMIQEDRVAPNTHIFTSTIGICGRVGYTKKAFSLFTKMKKYGLEPSMPTYTALFNACANSPWREDGLTRANRLLRQMSEKGIEPNAITLKGIVKAYGRLGELQTAFGLMDHMLGTGHGMDAEGWCHLLMACISDKDAGLKHAIEVWRWMRKRKTQFDLHHYNLLLRTVRDCGVGDAQFANKLLGGAKEPAIQSSHHSNPPGGSTERVSAGSGGHQHKPWWEDDKVTVHPQQTTSGTKTEQTTFEPETNIAKMVANERTEPRSEGLSPTSTGLSILDAQVPNILNPRGLRRRGGVDVIALGELDTAEKRLTLLGGVPGILSHMQRDGVKPDVRTFAMLLDMVPTEVVAEEDLLAAMTACNVKPDTDLLNQIIRRRCMRRSLESAKEVLLVFANLQEVPNLMTYASLALGCRNYESGLQLLDDMNVAGFEATTDIFGILMRRSGWDFRYKLALCQRMQAAHITPNKSIIEGLETSVVTGRRMLVQKERGEKVPSFFQRSKFPEEFREFMVFYKPWLMKSPLEKEIHPWTQYRQPTGGAEPDVETDNEQDNEWAR